MKITLYIDWREEKILTEKDYNAMVEETKSNEDDFEDYKNDCLEDYIEDFLDEKRYHRTFETIFNLSDSDKKEILDNVRKGYLTQVEQDFAEDYDKITIEV